MEHPILYRRRIFPSECVLLKDDIILQREPDKIVTKWNALKPKKHLHHGYSCYYLDKGYKISKFYQGDGSLLYWYCDIIESEYTEATNTLIVTDLLADVIVYPDGFVKVVDLDELATAIESNKITSSQLNQTLLHLNELLSVIYSGEFDLLKKDIEQYE